jgi:NAD-dependent deacetylase
MHGELLKAKCARCAAVVPVRDDLSVRDVCGTCGGAGGMRPDVVWFGEMPYRMEEIAEALDRCGLFVSIGTSGTVYPAAGFVREARLAGRAYCVELNLEASEGASYFHESREGPATDLVPAFVEAVLAKAG